MILLTIVYKSLTLNKFEPCISGLQRLIYNVSFHFHLFNVNFWFDIDKVTQIQKISKLKSFTIQPDIKLRALVICWEKNGIRRRFVWYVWVNMFWRFFFRCEYMFSNTTIVRWVVTTQPTCGSRLVTKISKKIYYVEYLYYNQSG